MEVSRVTKIRSMYIYRIYNNVGHIKINVGGRFCISTGALVVVGLLEYFTVNNILCSKNKTTRTSAQSS